MQLSDSQFIEALKQSDHAVYEQLFRHFYQPLCNYANNFLDDMDEAEEIVQQMFLNVWIKRNEIEIDTSLKSYLYRAVHNACLNNIKKVKVRKLYADELVQITEPVVEHTSQTVIKNELEKQIHNAINSLPEQCRLVFKLSRFEEMKYAEIAAHLGISIKTVENQMGKALKVLREKLKDYLPMIIAFFPWLFY